MKSLLRIYIYIYVYIMAVHSPSHYTQKPKKNISSISISFLSVKCMTDFPNYIISKCLILFLRQFKNNSLKIKNSKL